MYAAERQQRIMAEARRAGRVEVASLADSLGVAAETVRRDLTALERAGPLRRVHGGAIPVERLELEPTLATRTGRLADVKRRIAARVLDEVPERRHAAPRLRLARPRPSSSCCRPTSTSRSLTNSVAAASALSTHPGITLYLLGGRVRGITGAAVGDWATNALAGVVVDVAVHRHQRLLGRPRPHHPRPGRGARQGRHGRAAARRVRASPPTRARPATTTCTASPTLAEVDVVVTDTDLADDVAAELRAAGPQVVTA